MGSSWFSWPGAWLFFVIMMDQDKQPVWLPHLSDPIPRGGGGKESPLTFQPRGSTERLGFLNTVLSTVGLLL